MSKAILEFNLADPDDRDEFTRAVKGTQAYLALHDISNYVFRPARKYGYGETEIQEVLERVGQDGERLVELLESKFHEILRERDINLDDELR